MFPKLLQREEVVPKSAKWEKLLPSSVEGEVLDSKPEVGEKVIPRQLKKKMNLFTKQANTRPTKVNLERSDIKAILQEAEWKSQS